MECTYTAQTPFDGSCRGPQIFGDRQDLVVPAVQGVADHEVQEGGAALGAATGEQDTAVAGVTDAPASAAVVGVGIRGKEGEGEIYRLREGASGRGRLVRLLGVEESCVPHGLQEESEDGRRMQETVPAEELAVEDDAAVGFAGSGGPGDVSRIVEAEEDVLQDLRWEVEDRRHHAAAAVGAVGESEDRSSLLSKT